MTWENHTNTCIFLDVGTVGTNFYFGFEETSGKPLNQTLRGHQTWLENNSSNSPRRPQKMGDSGR